MDRKCDALGFCLSISLIISVMAIPTILSRSLRLALCDFKHCNIALNIFYKILCTILIKIKNIQLSNKTKGFSKSLK